MNSIVGQVYPGPEGKSNKKVKQKLKSGALEYIFGWMPTYEYECTDCEYQWEAFQAMKAGPLRKCPECGKPKARRLLSAGAGLLFKGTGFHTTDYRSESYKKAAKAESPGAGADKGKTGNAEKKEVTKKSKPE